jgi:hypothetical protein
VSFVSILLLVIGGVLVLLVILFVVLRLVSRSLRRQADAVRQRFPHAKLVVPGANFFGLESLGAGQVRGNGTLVLTGTELYFEKLVPRQDFHIPLSSISAIETPTSHLGKTVGRRLLKIRYRDDAGTTDAIAWYVPDLDTVKLELEAARGGPDQASTTTTS